MTGPLAGRGAVVTGGGRGIGAAIAGILADAAAAPGHHRAPPGERSRHRAALSWTSSPGGARW